MQQPGVTQRSQARLESGSMTGMQFACFGPSVPLSSIHAVLSTMRMRARAPALHLSGLQRLLHNTTQHHTAPYLAREREAASLPCRYSKEGALATIRSNEQVMPTGEKPSGTCSKDGSKASRGLLSARG